MEEVSYDFQTLLACIEQKNVLLTNLLNISKQIEVQSKQDDMAIRELLAKRQTFIDRTVKCDKLIKTQVNTFTGAFKDICQLIIKGQKSADFTKEQQKALDMVKKNDALVEKIIRLNDAARDSLEEKRNEAKDNLNQVRRPNSMGNLFKL